MTDSAGLAAKGKLGGLLWSVDTDSEILLTTLDFPYVASLAFSEPNARNLVKLTPADISASMLVTSIYPLKLTKSFLTCIISPALTGTIYRKVSLPNIVPVIITVT